MIRSFLCCAAALSLTGCGIISRPVVSVPRAQCASLVPDTWKQPVEGAAIPDTTEMSLLDQVKAWAGAFVAQTGQLSKANGRTGDTIEIVEKCETLVNSARPD